MKPAKTELQNPRTRGLDTKSALEIVRVLNREDAQVAAAVYRDRTHSVPDELTNAHGDAAFADYVWLASYSYRFSRHPAGKMPDHITGQPTPATPTAVKSAGTGGGL